MTHSPTQVLAAYLQEASDASFTLPSDDGLWPLYISALPDSTEVEINAAAIYDTTGVKHARLLKDGAELRSYGFQIKVRGKTYNEAWAKADEVSVLLTTVHDVTVELDGSTYWIDCVSQTTPPISMGQDEKRRANFSINGLIMLAQRS